MLLNIVRRLRRQADRLEWLADSGDSQKLSEACGMLHATVERVLDPGCLLMSFSAIDVMPGKNRQPVHPRVVELSSPITR